jgi:hypothetical protein
VLHLTTSWLINHAHLRLLCLARWLWNAVQHFVQAVRQGAVVAGCNAVRKVAQACGIFA